MLKEYQKTSVIKAEKVTEDNVWDLKDKYGLEYRYYPSDASAPSFILVTDSYKPVYFGDWIATGANGEHWVIVDEIFKKNYEELPNQPESEFERLFMELQSQIRAVSGAPYVRLHDKGLHEYEVVAYWPNGNKIARCYRESEKSIPQIDVIDNKPSIAFWVRIMAGVLGALSDFADKWKKLEESKLKQ